MSYLTIRELSKAYGDTQALDGFSLTVERGEIMALVGPDGAGKTTFIRILCRLLDPDTGHITLDSEDLPANFDRIKERLGYMPQQFSLYQDLTVEENMVFYGGIYSLTGEAYCKKRDYLYQFSNLAPFASRRAGALSGGMKQKLALSCTLMHDPELLILDEPTTGVDPLSRRQFWEILLNLKQQGVTILVATPYMDEVARGDRACFVFDGHKLVEGVPDEIAVGYEGQVFRVEREPSTTLLTQLNSLSGVKARRFGTALQLYFAPDSSIDQYAPALQAAGIDTSALLPVTPSLEDRFIQLMEQTS